MSVYAVLDLQNSPHRFTSENFVFHFSTYAVMNRFARKWSENRKEFNQRFKARYQMECDLSQAADFYLYNKTEKKGYFVTTVDKKAVFKCNVSVKLNGVILMKQD